MQQERFVPSNNNLIPFQIINNQSKCNNSNGKLDMLRYGLSQPFKNNLMSEWNSVGLLLTNEKQSPYYTPIKIDTNYAQFLLNTQKYGGIDNTTYTCNSKS